MALHLSRREAGGMTLSMTPKAVGSRAYRDAHKEAINQARKAARHKAAHSGEVRNRLPRARTVAVVSARRQNQIAVGAENQISFEVAIRKCVAGAARAGTLDKSSDWYGLSPEQILGAPLPPITGNGWTLPAFEAEAIAAALAKHPRTPGRRRSLAR